MSARLIPADTAGHTTDNAAGDTTGSTTANTVATPRRGHVTLVGAGPGDADLLTLKAIRALRQATVVLVDDLVAPEVLRYVRKRARIVHCGKRGGCASTPQPFIHRMMIAEAQHGERVVRLKGGDPFVFGRGGEEVAALQAAGISHSVVPGITAGIAAPASIGIPVTDRRWAQGVVFVTGHQKADAQPGSATPNWPALAQAAASGLTLVIYMGITHCAAITQALQAGGLPSHTPAGVIQHACTPQQRAHTTVLAELANDIDRLGLGSPAILVVGDVVRAAWAVSSTTASCDADSDAAFPTPPQRVVAC